jgi:sugar lactone lactonase YvrE
MIISTAIGQSDRSGGRRGEDMTEIRLFADAACALGEGPIWDDVDQVLFWVDIEGRRLFCRDGNWATTQSWDMPERIGSFALRAGGGMVCALQSGFAFFDPATRRIDWIARPDAAKGGNRFNDGKCDRAGRFWSGTMDAGGTRNGSLFRLDPGGSVHRMADGIGVPNSIAWSPDDRHFYFADTSDSAIYVYDFDAMTGAIANRRLFASTRSEPAWPDGSTVDAEGYLWNAQWGGWRLVRYAPDGTIDRVVLLPVQYPTSCAFGGPDLATLFVTSAIWDLTESQRAAQSWAGAVLALEPGVRGLPEPRFAG